MKDFDEWYIENYPNGFHDSKEAILMRRSWHAALQHAKPSTSLEVECDHKDFCLLIENGKCLVNCKFQFKRS